MPVFHCLSLAGLDVVIEPLAGMRVGELPLTDAVPESTPALQVRLQPGAPPDVAFDFQGPGFGLELAPRRLTLQWPPPMLDEPDINLADIVLWGLCLIDELAAPSLPLRPLYLHASCVVVDGRALLFTGHSTFGKSTISEMLAEAGRKIEDDRAFVLIDEAASTAWVADTSTAAEQWAQHSTLPRRDDWLVPIGGLFWLRKAPTFDLQPRSPATLAADLLDPPLIDTPGAAPARRLGALRMFAEAVPAQELSFRKDASALIDFLQQQGYLNTRSAHKTQL